MLAHSLGADGALWPVDGGLRAQTTALFREVSLDPPQYPSIPLNLRRFPPIPPDLHQCPSISLNSP